MSSFADVGRPASHEPASRLKDVMTYAASTGLRRFSLAPPAGGEYATQQSVGKALYYRTAAEVVSVTDADGRQRIKVPFRPFGHIVITEPEYMAGLFWYFDLLRAGYLFIHFLTTFDSHRVLLPLLFARGVLDRCGLRRTPSATLRWMAKSREPSYHPQPGRVLMISENLRRGGNQRQLLATASGLLRRGYHVKMLVLNRLEPSVSNFEEDVARLGITPEFASESVELATVSMLPPPGGVPPADCASLPRRLGFRIAAIAAAIKRHRPAVVHGWRDDPGVAGALAGCSVGTPRVVIRLASMATRVRPISKTELLRQAYRALARNPTVTILNNSVAGARDYEEWLGLPSRAISVLYNGFSPNLARIPDSDETAQFRASLGLSTGVAVVGTVMRFAAEKDPDLWLDTAAEIAKSRADVRFLISGYGQLEQRIRKKIKSPRLRGRVVLAGPVIDVGLIYSAIDVVLLTSAVEGLPNVMIEAQAAGRPVVATDVGGTTEAVLEGQTGIIVRSRSAKDIAKAVITMLDDVDQRSRVRTEGPEFVACRFDLERMIDETLRHYELPRG